MLGVVEARLGAASSPTESFLGGSANVHCYLMLEYYGYKMQIRWVDI